MLIFEVDGRRPQVDPTAVVAPTAVLSGAVTVQAGSHVSFGATLIGDEAPVTVGRSSMIRENVLIRSGTGHPVRIEDHVLVGAHSALYGCAIERGAFLATGVRIFHGAVIEEGAEIRINATVHVNSRVPAGVTVPIGWIAVGDPATAFPPKDHGAIWEIQRTLSFPETVYGIARGEDDEVDMRELTERAIRRVPGSWRRVE